MGKKQVNQSNVGGISGKPHIMRRHAPRKIKNLIDGIQFDNPISLGGWLQGKQTYLWFGITDKDGYKICKGFLHKRPLYRLAKAIVKEFERGASGA